MLYKTFVFLWKHPLAGKNVFTSIMRYVKWQFGTKILPFPVIYPFVEKTKLLASKGMTGATGNIYCGLHDFEEMGFALHFLRPDDFFADVGANIGSYTILTSGVIGANSLSFEPVPSTFGHLKDNICINHLEDKVQALNIGLGSESSTLRFTSGMDTVNHVLADGEENIFSLDVPVGRLDDYCQESVPALIKLDVEGFEWQVLQGAENTLHNPDLKAIIIELNGSGARYGNSDTSIHEHLKKFGFLPCKYSPFERELTTFSGYNKNGNTLYVRDLPFVQKRVRTQRKIRVLGSEL